VSWPGHGFGPRQKDGSWHLEIHDGSPWAVIDNTDESLEDRELEQGDNVVGVIPEIEAWLKANCPNAYIKNDDTCCIWEIKIVFPVEEEATKFKLFWL
jgi:hypothetical protein